MRPIFTALLMLTALLCFTGCLSLPHTPVVPPPGGIYENIKAPLTTNYHATPVVTAKTGRAMTRHIMIPFYPFLSVTWQEPATIENAARNGGMKEVEYADYEVMSVLGVYTEFTIIAYGQ